MPHTQKQFVQDVGFNDAFSMFGVNDILGLAEADCVKTRVAAGDYAYVVGASKTVTFSLNLSKIMKRSGYSLMNKYFMEQYGGTQADPIADTGGVYASDYTGQPDGAKLPRTTPVPKGIKILGFKVVYDPGNVIDLVALTCRVDKIVYADGVANAVTSVLASGANGLVVTKRATPRVVTVAMPAAEKIYRIVDLSRLTFEIGAQTGVGGQFVLSSIEVMYEFNFN